MANFWTKLPKPFTVLAPMEDVTDYVFREIVTLLPRPDVFFTEFTSADALFSPGRGATIHKLKFSEKQHPIVAQIWGVHPETISKASSLVRELGFSGVDINMGCPDKSVMKKGAGGAHCLNPSLAKEIIKATKEGAKDIPVSVKTRLGYNKIITEGWVSFLLEQKIDALTIHGRVALQRSKGRVHWEEIEKAVRLKNEISPQTILIGNGDVKSYKEVLSLHDKYKIDGVMIGRGIFSNPWVFEKSVSEKTHGTDEYLDILLRHINLFEEIWGNTKNFELMKKFFKMYVTDFPGASDLRVKLMTCKTANEMQELLNKNFRFKTHGPQALEDHALFERI